MSKITIFLFSLSVVAPPSAVAQETPLAEILPQLIQAEVRLAGPPPGSPFPSHEAHFIPGPDQTLTPFLFNQSIVSQLATLPLGTSAGGFSYTFDQALGTYTRSSNSFGSAFAERAITIGRGRWNIGANYQHVEFDSYEGRDLDDSSIRFYLTHQLSGNDPFFEGDLVEAALSMRLKADTFALFGLYGVTDRLDVGITVPIAHVNLDARIDATVLRLATLNTGPTSTIHTFTGGGSTGAFSNSGSASGFGDIILRAKYHLLQAAGGGLAVAFDLRTPTGDVDNLLGAGATQAKFLFVASSERNRFAPHLNIGFTLSGESDSEFVRVTDEFNYTAGTEVVLSPRLTITGDLVGRNLIDSGRLVEEPKTFNWRTAAGVTGSSTFVEFAAQPGNLNLLLGAAGVRYNPGRNLLISGSVLFPLTDAGIRSEIIPVVGFEYAF
jgi:hypothetical protein